MMAVSFQRSGRLYYLDPGPHQPSRRHQGARAHGLGPEVAECIWAPQWVDDDIAGLPVCAGLADEHDLSGTSRTGRAEPRRGSRPGGWSASMSCP